MTFERWQQLREILYPALALTPETRADYLTAACADDRYLRAQVESLLRYQETGEVIAAPSLPRPAPPVRAAPAPPAEFVSRPARDGEHQLKWLSDYAQQGSLPRRIAARLRSLWP
ncbi:MAG TPA: hypothetical protein VFC61_07680 [Blastocatellia bacterium]|jgi:hypothetical protein|nr:hypothetical protein [Blastocatellia bacterium]